MCFDVNLAGGLTSIASDNGDVWERIAQALTGSSNPLAAELWYCKSSVGGKPTITVTATGTATITAWDLTEWDAQFGDVVSKATGGDSTGTWSLADVIAGADDLTLFTMCNNDNNATNTPPPGFVPLAGNGSGSYVGYIEFGYLNGAASTQAGGTVGANGWAAAIAVLPPPATPPPIHHSLIDNLTDDRTLLRMLA